MSQKFCSECGKQLPDNVKFCPFCGNSLIDNKDPDKETPFTPTTSKNKIPAWKIIVGVICGIIVIYELFAAVSDFKMANQIKDNQEQSAVELTESINPSPSPTTSSAPWEDDKKHAYEFDPVETPFKPIEKESLTQAITDACIDLNGK